MRIGTNPNKDKSNPESAYLHQIIIPVYIPHFEDYFSESFSILKLCLESVFVTTNKQTFVTIVNNGSCLEVATYLDNLFLDKKIQEIIHTENIGKVNAILKGLSGHSFALVTISDSDVLFLSNWQSETIAIFNQIPKVGVVGIVPQFNMHKAASFNLLFDTFFNSDVKFIEVKDAISLSTFYDSIGWDKNYNPDYLKYTLGLNFKKKCQVLVGSGHFVATYKRAIFDEIVSNIPFKMGSISETYLDEKCLEKDYWRVTTPNNYAFHMGNSLESWMFENNQSETLHKDDYQIVPFPNRKPISKFGYALKNIVFRKLLKSTSRYKMFLRFKKLPKSMIEKY